MKKVSITKILGAVCILLGASFANMALALPIALEASLDGAQANAGSGTGSAGTGSATMTYDDTTMLFSWEVEWSGLSGVPFIAHFHGPATPAEDGAAVINIPVLNNPSMGSATLNTVQAGELLNGLWYINIHTSQNLGGEIRGQILRVDAPVPLPSTLLLVLLAAAGVAFRRRVQH